MKKSIVITGATGTLGSRILEYHYNRGDHITALSRCDHKIKQFVNKYPSVDWTMGDIRFDLSSCIPDEADIVYHCAASKHVDMGEYFPEQYHSVNYVGTINLARHVTCDKFVFFSTDKAVLPINFYGMTKALAEKHLVAIKKRKEIVTRINIFRWGNIVGSQGSVIHGLIKQIESGKVTLTHPDMTRFWLRINDAVQFAVNDEHDPNAEVLIHPNIKASKITDFAKAVAYVMGKKITDFEFTGPRIGEKLHEHLKYDHSGVIASDTAEQYSFDELCGLVAPTITEYLSSR